MRSGHCIHQGSGFSLLSWRPPIGPPRIRRRQQSRRLSTLWRVQEHPHHTKSQNLTDRKSRTGACIQSGNVELLWGSSHGVKNRVIGCTQILIPRHTTKFNKSSNRGIATRAERCKPLKRIYTSRGNRTHGHQSSEMQVLQHGTGNYVFAKSNISLKITRQRYRDSRNKSNRTPQDSNFHTNPKPWHRNDPKTSWEGGPGTSRATKSSYRSAFSIVPRSPCDIYLRHRSNHKIRIQQESTHS